MTVFGALLIYWVGSGLIMATYDATDATQVWALEGAGPGTRLIDRTPTPQPLPPLQSLGGISEALAESAAIEIASVRLRMVGSEPEIEFATAEGNRDFVRRFSAKTGEPMTQSQVEGNRDLPPAPNVIRRNEIKSWHRGNIAGITGQVVGLLTGLGLISIAVTGIGTYVRLWRLRKGTLVLFWSARESLWRRAHRWIAIVAAVLVLNLALTGSVLAYGEIQLWAFLNLHIGVPPPYPRPSPMPPLSEGALQGDIQNLIAVAYDSAQGSDASVSITRIELVSRRGAEIALVSFGGTQPHIKAFDSSTGLATQDWAERGLQQGNGYFTDWHQVIKRLHRGDIVGHFAGRYLTLATGLALAYLVTSGIVMYVHLLRRRAAGRQTLFWR
jgi:hypothetical protein